MSDSDWFDDAADEEEEGGGLEALLGGGATTGGFDLSNLLDQAMAVQRDLADKQAALADELVEGQAGGGAVTIVVTGRFEFREVRVRPDAVDPDDVDLLQDLVLAALHDATRAVNELQASAMGGIDINGLLGGG
jgi:DNA-binding YbaB/EbfC family protein